MTLMVKGAKDDDIRYLYLEQDDDGVKLQDDHWVILKITDDGLLHLYAGIDEGYEVDSNGRIKVVKDL